MTADKDNNENNKILNALEWCRRLFEALVLVIIGLTTLAITICWGYSHVAEAVQKDFAQPNAPIVTTNRQSAMSSHDR